ncbi:GNAT family N-acetyltransferase [Nodosilinea sp. PGN35]|uniref:GNAT family N-acetyltransferase n=1 Tax=Nodosilinea sp. PGN35 TaxID=3020489 RepID=UPI0023B237B6|nr:GNAT family N-acetyltransferase [Nodosilinea sp. TSF1-S3]MDF0368929.1 GNAT family N-acetyltransferase [Nodosilinea sp. TSF1-S3]
MQIDVITWYLEMLDPAQLRPKLSEHANLEIRQAEVPCPELSRFLYASVGGQWYWCDRLPWAYDRWLSYLNRPEVETWVAYQSGTPAGYIELEAQAEGSVEITCFGLLPQFIGQGLGGHLLTVGVQRAWARGTRRLWVHTCSLDGPYAYKNYESRGFTRYDTRVTRQDLPDTPPGPWPHSNSPAPP